MGFQNIGALKYSYFHLFLILHVTDSSVLESYFRICSDMKLSSYITVRSDISELGCAANCLSLSRNNQCLSASYNKSSHNCYLSMDEQELAEHVNDEDSEIMLFLNGTTCTHDGYLVDGINPVNDSQLSASSVRQSSSYFFGPIQARLHSQLVEHLNNTDDAGIWSPKEFDQNQFIQVEFSDIRTIRGIATQGSPVYNHYVTSYRMMYSKDCVNYFTYKNVSNTDMIFPGNFDKNTVVVNQLGCPVDARCVRINPWTWYNFLALRFDVVGCAP